MMVLTMIRWGCTYTATMDMVYIHQESQDEKNDAHRKHHLTASSGKHARRWVYVHLNGEW